MERGLGGREKKLEFECLEKVLAFMVEERKQVRVLQRAADLLCMYTTMKFVLPLKYTSSTPLVSSVSKDIYAWVPLKYLTSAPLP